MTNNTLRPCPFCGSTLLVEEATEGVEVEGYTYQHCWVECADCGARGPLVVVTDDTEQEDGRYVADYQRVRDRWNVCVRD